MKTQTRALIGAAAALLLMAGSGFSQREWPYPQDIPHPGPVSVGLAGSKPDVTRYLLVQGARNVKISPDGAMVGYISSVTGLPQIWMVASSGGAPRQLTWGTGADAFVWTPDGKGILYQADTNGDEKIGMNLLSADGLSERIAVAKSAAYREFGAFSSDGGFIAFASTERNGSDYDIYTADLKNGSTRLIAKGEHGFYARSWQPNGPNIVVSETRGESGNNLYLVNAINGETRVLFKPQTTSKYTSIEWTPDGSGFYMVTDDGRDLGAVAHYDLKSAKIEILAAPPNDVTALSLGGHGHYIAWITNNVGFNALFVRDLVTGKDIPAPRLPDGVYSIDFAKEAPVLSILMDGPQAPGEVMTWNVVSGATTQPIRAPNAGLSFDKMVMPQVVQFAARDGVQLSGLMYLPSSIKNPPILLAVHGGPTSQAMPTYQADKQYYVAAGIAVFDLNYRGSSGFGKRFAALNDKELHANEIGDIEDAMKWLKASGRVDTKRAAIGGASYGGYLTNAALGSFPNMFIAGVSAVGVSDWVTALRGAEPSLHASDLEEYGDVADPKVRQFFAKLSPINNVAKIKTPVLVETGANDPRDPPSESDRLVEAIRKAGGTVSYIRFPDEGHGIKILANRIYYYRRVVAFLEEQFGSKQ